MQLQQISEYEWRIHQDAEMRVPGIVYASAELAANLDTKTISQIRDVATLPGIVRGSYAMPDTHAGYGFPIGGVAAFDPKQGGVISVGGVGFDIACGVRTLLTGLTRDDILAKQDAIADALLENVPCGVGKGGDIILQGAELEDMLYNGASWAVGKGMGTARDLERTEEGGKVSANPDYVSDTAKQRIRDQIGSLGSGNHYLEIQYVESILDAQAAEVFELKEGDAIISIHCGSRGLGHQIGKDYIERMNREFFPKRKKGKKKSGTPTPALYPNRELASAPINSQLGQEYLGAMNAGINCALANRQVISHRVRQIFADIFPQASLELLYDVAHNTCKAEHHMVDGKARTLYVHRKGATRSFPPGHPALPASIRAAGQPVLVGGSMGTASYILAGTQIAMEKSFGSTCHGAGRALSRTDAKMRYIGRDVAASLAHQGILVRTNSFKGIAEEAPGAYKDIEAVVSSAAGAGLVRPVARVLPLVCVKG